MSFSPSVPTILNTSNCFIVGNTASGNALSVQQVGAGNVFAFSNAAGGSNVMVMNNLGRVGIGTTNPGQALQVIGNIQVGSSSSDYRQFILGGGNSTGYIYGCFAKYGDGIHMGYNFYNNNTNNVIPNTSGPTSRMSLGYGSIAMYTGGTNAEPTNLGYFQDSTGKVGIGTTNPATALDVFTGTMNAATVSATTLTGAGSGITALNMDNAGSGTLAVARGGTGTTSSTGSGSVVLSASPTFTGTVTAATVSATTLTGAGSGITALNMNNAGSGTLAVARGGTGTTSSTGSGSVVLSASPTFTGTVTAATVSATTLTGAGSGNIGINTSGPFANNFTNPYSGAASTGIDVFGSGVYDTATVLRLFNNASQYGRTHLQMLSQFVNSNDAWSLTDPFGRNMILFGHTTTAGGGGAYTYGAGIQYLAGNLGILVNGYSTSVPAFYVGNNGRVGIGTASPSYPLHVNGSVTSGTLSIRYFNASTTVLTTYSGTTPISIYATNDITTSTGFSAISDRRAKILEPHPSAPYLEFVDKIQVRQFSWIDKVEKDPRKKIGFFAQEVEEVLPDAVGKNTGVVPTIYREANAFTESTITVTNHGLTTEKKLEVVDPENGKTKIDIVRVIDADNLEVKFEKPVKDKLFVVGPEVDDSRLLNHDYLMAVSFGGLKELHALVKSQAARIEALEARLAAAGL